MFFSIIFHNVLRKIFKSEEYLLTGLCEPIFFFIKKRISTHFQIGPLESHRIVLAEFPMEFSIYYFLQKYVKSSSILKRFYLLSTKLYFCMYVCYPYPQATWTWNRKKIGSLSLPHAPEICSECRDTSYRRPCSHHDTTFIIH